MRPPTTGQAPTTRVWPHPAPRPTRSPRSPRTWSPRRWPHLQLAWSRLAWSRRTRDASESSQVHRTGCGALPGPISPAAHRPWVRQPRKPVGARASLARGAERAGRGEGAPPRVAWGVWCGRLAGCSSDGARRDTSGEVPCSGARAGESVMQRKVAVSGVVAAMAAVAVGLLLALVGGGPAEREPRSTPIRQVEETAEPPVSSSLAPSTSVVLEPEPGGPVPAEVPPAGPALGDNGRVNTPPSDAPADVPVDESGHPLNPAPAPAPPTPGPQPQYEPSEVNTGPATPSSTSGTANPA